MAGGEWVDATAFLRRVCTGMAAGELLHGPNFSLFESTTAIEIGDPKMDIGLHRSEETGTAEELIAGGSAPVALAPPLLLAVMDRLLCLEATWHTGSMLPQTVFASLYMLQPDRLTSNAPLNAYCLALRSACSLFVDMVHAGSVTEDEDFSVHTFGIRMLDLPGPKPVAAALRALATAEEALEQLVAGGGGGSGSGSNTSGCSASGSSTEGGQQQAAAGKVAADAATAGDGGSINGGGAMGEALGAEHAAALLARIRFRRLVLEAVQSLQQYSQAGVEQARRQCQLAEAQLQLLADTASLAAPLDQAPAFVPDVNRRHMGLVPPRPVHAMSLGQAVEHWRGLLRGLAAALHSLLFVKGSWPSLKAALIEFASHNYHSIVRSAMHLQLMKPLPPPPPASPSAEAPGGQLAGSAGGAAGAPAAVANGGSSSSAGGGRVGGGGSKKPAAEPPSWCPGQQMVCREFGLNSAALPGPEAALFVEQATIAIQGQAYALCLNRCRQRRRLRRQLEDWRNIFDHGFNADVMPAWQEGLAKAGWRWTQPQDGLQGQGPAASWAEREAAACAQLHLQLGFPLDLYAPYEYVQLYWYCDYLLDAQQRMASHLHGTHPPPKRAGSGGARGSSRAGSKQRGSGGGSARGGGGSGGARGGGGQLSSEEHVAAAREFELLALDVERLMCQGMFRAAIALQQLGCIMPPDAPFNSEEQRYEQRFGCMGMLCRPELLPYEHFRASTDPGEVPPARVLAAAHASFQRAAERAAALLQPPLMSMLRQEQARHLEGVQRTATQNSVATKLLAATSARAAAAAAASGSAGAAPAAPAFKVSFDLKAALAASTALFYPAIVLKH